MNKNYFIAGTIICMICAIISMFYSKTSFFIFLLLMVTSIVMTNVVSSKTEKQNIDNDLQKIDNLILGNGLIKNQIFINLEHSNAIMLDKEHQLITVFKKVNNDFQLTSIPFSSLIQSEIVEDGVSVIKTSKESQIGGALIGGVIAGNVGAVIGGMGATRTSHDEVRNIQLKITVNNLTSPLHSVDFMSMQQSMDKNNPIYKQLHDKVNHWHNLISIIIKRQENNVASNH